jgi:hypothetical protein
MLLLQVRLKFLENEILSNFICLPANHQARYLKPDFWGTVRIVPSPLAAEDPFWVLARVLDPGLIDDRLARPKTGQRPRSPVEFVSHTSQPSALDEFVWIAVGFCPFGQKREHQFLRFMEAQGEFMQARFVKSGFGCGYQPRFTEVAEVPRNAVFCNRPNRQNVAAVDKDCAAFDWWLRWGEINLCTNQGQIGRVAL